jgi:hypothetical protein
VKIGDGAESSLDLFDSNLDAGCYDGFGVGDPQSNAGGFMAFDALGRGAHSSFGSWVDGVVGLACHLPKCGHEFE